MPADDTGPELPGEVYQAAMARLATLRYDPHPDNRHARHGLSDYAFAEVLRVAFAAGRASVLEEAREEWGAVWGADHVMTEPGWTEADARGWANGDGDLLTELTVVRRIATEWQAVDGAQAGRQPTP